MPSYVLAAQEIAPTNKKCTTTTTTTITNDNKTNAIKTVDSTTSTSITVHHYNSTTNQAISPQRNLSLNLSPQYVDVQQQQQQQHRKQSKQQLGQKATRSSSRQLKSPLIKSTTTTTKNTDANFTTTTKKMFANVSNNLVGAISSDDAYSERALLLRGAENVAGSGVTQQLFNTINSTTTTVPPSSIMTTTTKTINHDNNNQNSNTSFNIRTKPTTLTKIPYNNNNIRNNYGSTLIARNIVDGGNGADGIDEADFLQTTDDDMLSDVATTANTETETVASSINDNDEQKNSRYQMRQNITPTTAAAPTTTTGSTNTNKKTKMSKLGSKNVGLKRVSFGSSKGSMVETLVFETPTPLSEHVEPAFGFETQVTQNQKSPSNNQVAHLYKANMDDSGIEIQEESERSIVRVSIYQSTRPQQVCTPEYLTRFEEQNPFDNNLDYSSFNSDDIMTATTIPGYDRQQSTDSGWDNPFRPGGDLSREADEIVNLIRGGKPITPTDAQGLGNGNAQHKSEEHYNGKASGENVTKSNITQTQSIQNGTNAHRTENSKTGADNNGVTSSSQVSKQVVPGPTSASHVVIDEKKNKKKGCCVIQ